MDKQSYFFDRLSLKRLNPLFSYIFLAFIGRLAYADSMAEVEDSCPLCGSDKVQPRHQLGGRDFLRCMDCRLIFVPDSQLLPPEEEKSHYDFHNNDPADQAYRRFLSQLTDPLLAVLPSGSRGLDFGCGPGPALNHIMEEAGHSVALYDPFYAPDPSPLDAQYDFITATEVAEHLHHPRDVFERLWRILRPGGWLGIMTWRTDNVEQLDDWHYMRDPTHVCFFADVSLSWLARHLNGELRLINAQTALIRKEE